MALIVRGFEEADRPALRRLYVASRNAAFNWGCSDRHRLADFDADTKGERVLVAVLNGEVSGFASVWEPDSFLHHLFVHPAVFRQGVGKALMLACTPFFSKPPLLKCLKANVHAASFYGSQGWIVLAEDFSADGVYLLMEGPYVPAGGFIDRTGPRK